MTPELLVPDWPAPASVRAAQTTRIGGVSRGPYAGLNLGAHCGDDPAAVAANRALLRAHLQLPAEPLWLQQVHGTRVLVNPRAPESETLPAADACVLSGAGAVAAVMTADCLPVLLCDAEGSCVAAAHAGWRGLAAGVLEATVAAMPVKPARLMAWLGPAIGPASFEVGAEVYNAFTAEDAALATCFRPQAPGKYLADLYGLARARLHRCGVQRVYGDVVCTYENEDRFYSFRRDGRCGRMASLIWLQAQ